MKECTKDGCHALHDTKYDWCPTHRAENTARKRQQRANARNRAVQPIVDAVPAVVATNVNRGVNTASESVTVTEQKSTTMEYEKRATATVKQSYTEEGPDGQKKTWTTTEQIQQREIFRKKEQDTFRLKHVQQIQAKRQMAESEVTLKYVEDWCEADRDSYEEKGKNFTEQYQDLMQGYQQRCEEFRKKEVARYEKQMEEWRASGANPDYQPVKPPTICYNMEDVWQLFDRAWTGSRESVTEACRSEFKVSPPNFEQLGTNLCHYMMTHKQLPPGVRLVPSQNSQLTELSLRQGTVMYRMEMDVILDDINEVVLRVPIPLSALYRLSETKTQADSFWNLLAGNVPENPMMKILDAADQVEAIYQKKQTVEFNRVFLKDLLKRAEDNPTQVLKYDDYKGRTNEDTRRASEFLSQVRNLMKNRNVRQHLSSEVKDFIDKCTAYVDKSDDEFYNDKDYERQWKRVVALREKGQHGMPRAQHYSKWRDQTPDETFEEYRLKMRRDTGMDPKDLGCIPLEKARKRVLTDASADSDSEKKRRMQ